MMPDAGAVFNEISAAGKLTVNVGGGIARATFDYVLESGITLGLAYYQGLGKATGSGPDALENEGFTVEDATLRVLALNVGARF